MAQIVLKSIFGGGIWLISWIWLETILETRLSIVRAAYEERYASLGSLCKLRERKSVFCDVFIP
jgi:hypothetical protein